MCVFAAVYGRSAKRIVRVVLVEPIIFVENGDSRRFNGGNVSEHIPHNFEMVIHLASAAHIEAFCHIFASVATAACQIKFFEKVNVFAFHLSVTDKIERRGKPGKTRSDDISRFFVNAFRLFRTSERFIVTCRIIHNGLPPIYFFCLYYTYFSANYNKQKKTRDKELITGILSVKIFIIFGNLIKLYARG